MVFIRPLIRYADFSGRARRSEYWGFVLFQTFVGGLLTGTAVISLTQAPEGGGEIGFFACLTLAALAALAFVTPHLAVTVRRLHDTNRSAWWLLLQAPGALSPVIFFGAAVGMGGGGTRSPDAVAAAMVSAAAGAMLLLMVGQVCNTILMVILWMRGTDGENRYGADPRYDHGRLGAGPGAGTGRLDEARLDAIFAQARQAAEAAAPVRSAWPEAPAATGFGRRGV